MAKKPVRPIKRGPKKNLAKKVKYALARVKKPKYDKKTNTLLVPLIRLPDDKPPFMEATIVYHMLNHGFSMSEIRQIRRIPKSWTSDAVVQHINQYGEREYKVN